LQQPAHNKKLFTAKQPAHHLAI